MYSAGIDSGSRTIKMVLFESRRNRIFDKCIADQAVYQQQLASDMFDNMLRINSLNRDDIEYIVATGYGRNLITFADTAITEITCHAAGIDYVMPEAGTIIDIGGQDSKIIHLDANAKVRDFAINDRCAAGTGRFLEVVSKRLQAPFELFDRLVNESLQPSAISSMCVVFAETEIIGLLASGCNRADIIAGVQESIARRVASMAQGPLKGPICFAGGVALVSGMNKAMEKALGLAVEVAPLCQFTGALGAAVIASDRVRQIQK